MTKKDEIVKKIKSKGYWEVNIHPEIYNKNRLEKTKLEEIIQKAIVYLRGWDYPHLYGREDECESGPYPITKGEIYGIEKYIYWEEMIEFWRMTQSANFIHLFSITYDWRKGPKYRNIWPQSEKLEGKKLLGTLGTLYTLTEIFEFTRRLALQNIFEDNLVINIKLYDLYQRELIVDSINRMPFYQERISKIDEPWNWNKLYPVNELLNNFDKFALDAFKDLVYLFKWEPPIDNLKNDQQKFLQGKL